MSDTPMTLDDEKLRHYIGHNDLVGPLGTPAITTGELAAISTELLDHRTRVAANPHSPDGREAGVSDEAIEVEVEATEQDIAEGGFAIGDNGWLIRLAARCTAHRLLSRISAIAPAPSPVPAGMDEASKLFTYTRTFNAIAAAVRRDAVGIGISVRAFIEAFGPIAAPQSPAPEPQVKGELERIKAAASKAYQSCMSAWAAGEPAHRVKTMLDDVEALGTVLGELGAPLASPPAKAEGDGWIEWHGRGRPVFEDDRVLIRQRGGNEIAVIAGTVKWSHDGRAHDIIAYRLALLTPGGGNGE